MQFISFCRLEIILCRFYSIVSWFASYFVELHVLESVLDVTLDCRQIILTHLFDSISRKKVFKPISHFKVKHFFVSVFRLYRLTREGFDSKTGDRMIYPKNFVMVGPLDSAAFKSCLPVGTQRFKMWYNKIRAVSIVSRRRFQLGKASVDCFLTRRPCRKSWTFEK